MKRENGSTEMVMDPTAGLGGRGNTDERRCLKVFRAILSITGMVFVGISVFFWFKTFDVVDGFVLNELSDLLETFVKAVFFSLSVLLIYGFDGFLGNIVCFAGDILNQHSTAKISSEKNEP